MKQMTLIEMDGFLKGEYIPGDLKVNETSAEYLVRKFCELESKLETALRECRSAGITIDNLEARCAALATDNEKAMEAMRQADAAVKLAHEKFSAMAAENARLKSAVTQQIELRAEIKKAGKPPHADFWVQPICESEEKVKRALEETPATDAFLAEVRAQGGAKALEDFAEFNIESIDPLDDEYTEVLKETARAARGFAAKLRREASAAMLQSGNFRVNKNSSTNYPVIPSEVLSAILKVAKIRADFDDFDGDRRGIGDCLDEAEQELIVTINKYASQLAAEPIATNDVREQTAIPPVPVIQADVAQAIEKLKRKLVECNRYNYCADAVKGVEYACHAAMLQGDEPVTDNTNQQFESLSRGDK